MFDKIFNAALDKKQEDIKQMLTDFRKDHPVAVGVMCVMGAVIFAQHVELRCLRAAHSSTVVIL